MTGETLGHYQILEKLGAGGMGDVFKAKDTRLNRFVAIKVLKRERVADPERKRRFIQEAQSASALNHPNIVVIHDINQQDGVDYMVMEFIAGKTLDALIPRLGMRLGEALRVAVQMADGLTRAHSAGIIHRDLKPSNVIVSDSGLVKILDFGLAKLTEVGTAEDDSTRTERPETEEGTIMGTAAYMSPEQAEGRKLDARSDIFSFGVVLYEMVTGRRPFQGDSRISTLSAILKEEPKPLENVPADLEKIIRRCLRKDAARRFQHMDDLKIALDEVREDSESGKLAKVEGATRRRGIPAWVWAGAAAIPIAAWAWYALHPESKPVEALRKLPLTSYAGSEIEPTFSPDGRQVAFAWNGENRDNFDIYVKMVDGGEPLRLTRDPAPELGPSWSPDGKHIAFWREGAIYLISPLGGVERKVTGSAYIRGASIAWTPDSTSLAFPEVPAPQAGALTLLNLETGSRRKLTTPPQTSGGDSAPGFSPGGRSFAFIRRSSPVGASELLVMPFDGGATKSLPVPVDFIYESAWAADGKDLLVTVERGGTTSLWRVPVESGQPPFRIPGLDDGARDAAVSAATQRLAYSRSVIDENIWSLSGASKTQLIASTRRDFNPQFSPGATRIAFSSDRTGGWEIYASDASGGRVVQLTSFGNVVADSVRWSPDGRDIAFGVLQGGNRDIYIMPAEGGVVRRLTNEPSDDGRPSFSMDGKSIYFRSNRSGKEEIWKMPRDGGAATQVTKDGGFEALETLDGKTLYFTRSRTKKGLWSMPPAGGEAKAVAGVESLIPGRWGVTEVGVCYLERAEKLQSIVCWNSASGKKAIMGTVDKPMFSAPPSFSVSRDGKRFLWNQTDHQDADLVLVEGFR